LTPFGYGVSPVASPVDCRLDRSCAKRRDQGARSGRVKSRFPDESVQDPPGGIATAPLQCVVRRQVPVRAWPSGGRHGGRVRSPLPREGGGVTRRQCSRTASGPDGPRAAMAGTRRWPGRSRPGSAQMRQHQLGQPFGSAQRQVVVGARNEVAAGVGDAGDELLGDHPSRGACRPPACRARPTTQSRRRPRPQPPGPVVRKAQKGRWETPLGKARRRVATDAMSYRPVGPSGRAGGERREPAMIVQGVAPAAREQSALREGGAQVMPDGPAGGMQGSKPD